MARATKIIATLGPSIDSYEAVEALVAAGMDAARLNFSHGEQSTHDQMVRWVREAADAAGRPVAVIQDIQGPKIRTGTFTGGSVDLGAGDRVEICEGEGECPPGKIYVSYGHLTEDIGEGDRVVLADGLLRGVVRSVGDSLEVEITEGGTLGDRKGVAFPDSTLQVGSLTDKDRSDLEYGKKLDVDFVAASFVRSGEDVDAVRELAGDVPIIAKVELASAYENLDSILAKADGVMVARGDLGVQLPLERIPFVQAEILRRTNAAGLLSITATEMLESMVHNQRPTRAEVTDVTNAINGGSDAVMLSAETAIGDDPARVVEVMALICEEAERHAPHQEEPVAFLENEKMFASAMAQAATEVAHNLGMRTIVAFTHTGRTALLLSKYRPSASIVSFVTEEPTYWRLALYWGVRPVRFDKRDSTDRMLQAAEKHLEKSGMSERGEGVVMVAGIPPGERAPINLMKVHVIGERLNTRNTFESSTDGRSRHGG